MSRNLALSIIAVTLLAFAAGCLAAGEDFFAILAFVGAFFLILEVAE